MFTHPGGWCCVRAYVWPPHIFASCSWWPLPHSLCSPRQWSSQIVHLRTGWKRGGPLEFAQTRYEQTRRGQQHNGAVRQTGRRSTSGRAEQRGRWWVWGAGGLQHQSDNEVRKVLLQPTNNVDQTFKRRENFYWTFFAKFSEKFQLPINVIRWKRQGNVKPRIIKIKITLMNKNC